MPLLSFPITPWRDDKFLKSITYPNKISRRVLSLFLKWYSKRVLSAGIEMTVLGQPHSHYVCHCTLSLLKKLPIYKKISG
jgi:hypothetical protein